MSYPVFYVPSGDVLPVFFHTYDGGTGASITASGLAVTDIEIYKDGSVTQRASDAGYTLLDTDGLDFDGLTGIHGFSIDTGDNTDAGFYTVGAWFTVVVSAVTIDAQTVSFIACQFRLMPAESVAGKPKVDVDAWLGTAAATPTTAGVPEVDITHWSGTAVAAVDTAGYPKVTVKSGTGTGEISLSSGLVTAGTVNDKTGYAITSTEHTNIADALLKRDMSAVTGESARSPLNALRFLRNKWVASGGTLTVYKEDDTTSAWTSALTDTAGANPITASDPA